MIIIEKVIGATVTQLIFLLSRDFIKLIGLAMFQFFLF